jgi:lipid-A-disaccharide synthase
LKRETAARMLAAAPDVFVGVDAPEFNLNLVKPLHAAGLRTVQYVSPQVWAWRQGRVTGMARTLDLVLCLLPFEKPFYDAHGLPAVFVGHPLADQVPLQPDRAAARNALGLPQQGRIVAVLPGSRRGEVSRLGADFAGAIAWLAARRPDLRFVAPMANEAARELFAAALAAHAPGVHVTLLAGQAQAALIASDCVIVASGTATLETLLCKRPMVVAYRLSAMTAWVFRALGLMKAAFFAQPNLLAGRALVPELLQSQVSPAALGEQVLAFLDDPVRVAALEREFAGIHVQLRQDAAARAAEAVIALARMERRAR